MKIRLCDVVENLKELKSFQEHNLENDKVLLSLSLSESSVNKSSLIVQTVKQEKLPTSIYIYIYKASLERLYRGHSCYNKCLYWNLHLFDIDNLWLIASREGKTLEQVKLSIISSYD